MSKFEYNLVIFKYNISLFIFNLNHYDIIYGNIKWHLIL